MACAEPLMASRRWTDRLPAGRCPRRAAMASLAISMLLATAAFPDEQAETRELRGKLEDGTSYMLRVPADWNGVVFIDLDMVWWEKRPFFQHLVKEGYAIAGTQRRREPGMWDPAGDVCRVQQALALFREKVARPKRVIAIGKSAGGAAAIGAAELHADTVDAAIAMCATTDVLIANQGFDLFFILKALLAPDDPQLVFFDTPSRNTPQLKAIEEHWMKLLDSVGDTPEGRARIALAFTMAQYAELLTGDPRFRCTAGSPEDPVLDLGDPEAVAGAMLTMARTFFVNTRLGRLRTDLNLAGRRYVGNDGADYRHYYQNGHPEFKKVVEALYRKAGLDIEADIARVDEQPRVPFDPEAASEIYSHRRTHRGTPQVPLFRLDQIFDPSVSTDHERVYSEHVRRNGREHFYRSSVVDRRGHCNATLAEKLTALRVVEHRLDTGEWPATDARSLNEMAASLELDGARFIDYNRRRYNGQWRLHAYCGNFDLSFDHLRERIARCHAQHEVTDAGREQLEALLDEAQQHEERQEWQQAKEALLSFQEKATDSELVPDEEAGGDLAWDARLMSIQMERRRRQESAAPDA